VIGDILQPTHLLFVLVIALLVLGPKRLPEVGKSLGRGLRDFRTALSGEDQDRDRPNEVLTPTPAPAPPPAESSQPEREPANHAG
jgi:sec-independent protein translocase protein TatA